MTYNEETCGVEDSTYILAEAENAKELFAGLHAKGIGSAQIIKVADDLKSAIYLRQINGVV